MINTKDQKAYKKSQKYQVEGLTKKWMNIVNNNSTIIHIKQPSTIFQTSEPYFPNQFLQQNNRLAADPSMTQWIPNIWNTSPERAWAKSRWIKRWSTVSPFLQHIQHHFANGKPLLVRLSNIRILPEAAGHIKNTTFLERQGGNWHLKLEKFFSTPLGNINKIISIRSQAKPFVIPIKIFRINILYQGSEMTLLT